MVVMVLAMKVVEHLEHTAVMLPLLMEEVVVGSGYTSGDATILETQLGGNSSTNAFVTFEYVAQ